MYPPDLSSKTRKHCNFRNIHSCCSNLRNSKDDWVFSIRMHLLHLTDSVFPFYLISAEQSVWSGLIYLFSYHMSLVVMLSFLTCVCLVLLGVESVLSSCLGRLGIFCVIIVSPFPWQMPAYRQHPRESTELSLRNALHNLHCCRSTQDSESLKHGFISPPGNSP